MPGTLLGKTGWVLERQGGRPHWECVPGAEEAPRAFEDLASAARLIAQSVPDSSQFWEVGWECGQRVGRCLDAAELDPKQLSALLTNMGHWWEEEVKWHTAGILISGKDEGLPLSQKSAASAAMKPDDPDLDDTSTMQLIRDWASSPVSGTRVLYSIYPRCREVEACMVVPLTRIVWAGIHPYAGVLLEYGVVVAGTDKDDTSVLTDHWTSGRTLEEALNGVRNSGEVGCTLIDSIVCVQPGPPFDTRMQNVFEWAMFLGLLTAYANEENVRALSRCAESVLTLSEKHDPQEDAISRLCTLLRANNRLSKRIRSRISLPAPTAPLLPVCSISDLSVLIIFGAYHRWVFEGVPLPDGWWWHGSENRLQELTERLIPGSYVSYQATAGTAFDGAFPCTPKGALTDLDGRLDDGTAPDEEATVVSYSAGDAWVYVERPATGSRVAFPVHLTSIKSADPAGAPMYSPLLDNSREITSIQDLIVRGIGGEGGFLRGWKPCSGKHRVYTCDDMDVFNGGSAAAFARAVESTVLSKRGIDLPCSDTEWDEVATHMAVDWISSLPDVHDGEWWRVDEICQLARILVESDPPVDVVDRPGSVRLVLKTVEDVWVIFLPYTDLSNAVQMLQNINLSGDATQASTRLREWVESRSGMWRSVSVTGVALHWTEADWFEDGADVVAEFDKSGKGVHLATISPSIVA
jgi:hypothetical protein